VSAQVDRSLVSWIPGIRRFYAGGILFDERGRVLGYADFDGCAGECPRIQDMPLMLRDLDTFTVAARPGSDSVEVGQLVEGQERERAENWVPWRRAAARTEDMQAADAPTMPRGSPTAALSLREGSYVVVDGDVVRSTAAEPVICQTTTQPGTCGKCVGDRLQLAGIGASDAAHIHPDGFWRDPAQYFHDRGDVYVEAEPGTFLVQRQGTGFLIVAGIFRGNCSGSW
jgi:hypothetical protein